MLKFCCFNEMFQFSSSYLDVLNDQHISRVDGSSHGAGSDVTYSTRSGFGAFAIFCIV